jgi:plasmid maintenance system antidote protein VapI
MDRQLNEVRVQILRRYRTQSDFALAVGEHESRVSQVLRGRRRLSKDRAERWCRLLMCDPQILMPVSEE